MITLDEKVENDVADVQRLIASTAPSDAAERDIAQLRATAARMPRLSQEAIAGQTFYSEVVRRVSQGTRSTAQQVEYLDAYEHALSVFRIASRELRTTMDVLTLENRLAAQKSSLEARNLPTEDIQLSANITDAIMFSNRYALHFAGQVGLQMLGVGESEVETVAIFEGAEDSKDRDMLTKRLIRAATGDLNRIVDAREHNKVMTEDGHANPITDNDLKSTLQHIFTSWVNQFSWDTFKDIAQARGVADERLQYKGFSLTAGAFSRKYDVVDIDDKFMNIGRKQVIGPAQLGNVIWRNLKLLSAYDPETQRNIHTPAKTIFAYGDPGCGKTFEAHAYLRDFGALCKERGIPAWIFTHSVTDYASEYQNKTANKLAELGEKIKTFPGIVVMYVADADTIFQSRTDPHITAEEQKTTGVYLKFFDGTLVPKRGQFMAVMDANYIESIDAATRSRVFDEIVHVQRWDDPTHFADYARVLITKGGAEVPVSDAEWTAIGQHIYESGMSNRTVNHVLGHITGGYDIPEELIGAPIEDHVKYRDEHLRSINHDFIIGKFDAYDKTQQRMEQASAQTRLDQQLAMFRNALGQDGTRQDTGVQ